jgi:hypothetical protein
MISNKKNVLLSSSIGDGETQNLKFLSDEDGVYISSFRVEKYGDEPTYFSLQLTFEEFQTLQLQLSLLIPKDLDTQEKTIYVFRQFRLSNPKHLDNLVDLRLIRGLLHF